jgi:hypothetical protein
MNFKMDQYRKDLDKIYNRVMKIVSRGQSQLQTYYDFVDEIINNGQSVLLQDVYYTKFKIDTTKFDTIDSLKKNTFKQLASNTESSTNLSLENLLNLKSVTRLGTQFFDLLTKQYLGDIKMRNIDNITDALEVYTFIPKDMKQAIPTFLDSPKNTLKYQKEMIVYYGEKLFKCTKDYTWDRTNQITPLSQDYWCEIYPGTQSLTYVLDPNKNVVERFSEGIDILRKYYYIDYSNNKYVEPNFIDEYFE